MRSSVRSLTFGGIVMLALSVAAPAAAHETRAVGPYEFTVGFWEEPAFASQPNGPEVTISRGDDPVVEGVELQVDVTFGEETTTFDIEPAFVVGVFGEEGNYNADFFPTRPGTYGFRLYGTVGGREVDETFTSGPETFNDVNDPSEFAFPVEDPSNADLAARLEQETARVDTDLATAEADAATAKTLGLVGTVLGALGLIVALVVVLRTRRPTA